MKHLHLSVMLLALAVTGCRLFKKPNAANREASSSAPSKRDKSEPMPGISFADSALHKKGDDLPTLTLPVSLTAGFMLDKASRKDRIYGALPVGLKVLLKRDGEVIDSDELAGGDAVAGDWVRGTLNVSEPGVYHAVATINDRSLVTTNNVFVAKVPALGEPCFFTVAQVLAQFVWSTKADSKEYRALRLGGWQPLDVPSASLVEWRKDGEFVKLDEQSAPSLERRWLGGVEHSQNKLPPHRRGECFPAWEYQQPRFSLPDSVSHVGAWEAIVHRQGLPSYKVAFKLDDRGLPSGEPADVDSGLEGVDLGATRIPSDAASEKALTELAARTEAERKATDSSDYPVSAEEFRALTRSAEVRELRLKISKEQFNSWGKPPPIDRKTNETDLEYLRRQHAADKRWHAAVKVADKESATERAILWKKMQPLIATHGGPWSDAERPVGVDR